MTEQRAKTTLQLEDILGELKSIAEAALDLESNSGEPIPVDRLATEVESAPEVRFRHYISFLDELECVSYDRSAEAIELGEAIDEPIEAPPNWIDEVEFEFADVLEEASYSREETGELAESPSEIETDASGYDSVDDAPIELKEEATLEAESSIVEEIDIEEPSAEGPPTPPEPLEPAEPEEAPDEEPSQEEHTEESTTREASNDSSDDTTSMNERKRRKSRSERTSSRKSKSDDRYERLEEIGTGGLGTVYEGRHKPLDRRVAIKEISNVFDVFADIQRGDIIDRFRAITRSQARISHPAIAQVYDMDPNREYPIVVTEYAPNGSLRRLIDDDDSRTLRVALKYFIQILHGLNAAHRDGLIHGNIKPENVLLDVAGNAKLSDFGLSTLVDLEGASDQVYVGVGAVAYMAPEQFQNPNAATTESDIYSLGIMFYEMLTGKVPGRRSPMPSSFYPDIPRKLDDIFDRMSMDGAEDRYSSIEAILRDFYGADEIMELLDRQSGVVFLRDPLKYGDQPLADEDGEIKSAEEAEPLQPIDAGQSGDVPDDAEPAEASDEEDGAEPEEQTEQAETSEPEADEKEAGEKEADGPEGAEASPEEEEEQPEAEDEESDAADEEPDPEDDEVLDKLDEYGEMFDEE